MSSQREEVGTAPSHAAVDRVGGNWAMEVDVSLDRSIRRAMSLETYDKQKMARLLRACLLAKYLRNDSVPCELQKGLYLGSIGAAFNKVLLQSLKVTHILSVANTMDIPSAPDVKHLRIKVLDNADVDLAQHFDTCFSFIDEARKDGGGVLVHCFAGRSRRLGDVLSNSGAVSLAKHNCLAKNFCEVEEMFVMDWKLLSPGTPKLRFLSLCSSSNAKMSVTVVVAYLMKTYNMRLVQAISYVTSKRKEAQPNPGFMRQLQSYDKQLEGTGRPVVRQTLD